MNPTVTVVIPTYNRPDLVGNAIQSVLDQTFDDFEILVVDDGLEKSAKKAVADFDDPRVRYIAHKESKGCSGAKNTGIREARGEFVAFLDDDDVWLPEKLNEQISAFSKASEDIGFSFTGSVEHFDDRKYIKQIPDGVADYFDLALRNLGILIDSSMMYRKSIFNHVGLLDESFPTHTGAEFIIRVSKEYKGVGINKPLVQRAMATGHTQMGTNIENRIEGRLMLLDRYKNDFAQRPTFLAKHIERLAKFYRQIGDYTNARKYFLKSFKLQPRLIRFANYISCFVGGLPYRIVKKIKK